MSKTYPLFAISVVFVVLVVSITSTITPANAQPFCSANSVQSPIISGQGFAMGNIGLISWTSSISPTQNQTILYHVQEKYTDHEVAYFTTNTQTIMYLASESAASAKVAVYLFDNNGQCTGKSANSNIVNFAQLSAPTNLMGKIQSDTIELKYNPISNSMIGNLDVKYHAQCHVENTDRFESSSYSTNNTINVPIHKFIKGDNVKCHVRTIVTGSDIMSGEIVSAFGDKISLTMSYLPTIIPGVSLSMSGDLGEYVTYSIGRSLHANESVFYILEAKPENVEEWDYWNYFDSDELTGTINTKYLDYFDYVQWRVKVIWFDDQNEAWQESSPSNIVTIRDRR